MNEPASEFEAKLNKIYARCLDQIRTISAFDPTQPIEGWDQYTCTCANEFALDLAHAWSEHTDNDDVLTAYNVIRDGSSTDWLRERDQQTPAGFIAYGFATFANVLKYIEAIREGRFDPTAPNGIKP